MYVWAFDLSKVLHENASWRRKISYLLPCVIRNFKSLNRDENIKHKYCFWPRNYAIDATCTIVRICLSLINQASIQAVNEWHWPEIADISSPLVTVSGILCNTENKRIQHGGKGFAVWARSCFVFSIAQLKLCRYFIWRKEKVKKAFE